MKLGRYQRLVRLGTGALMLVLVQGLDLIGIARAGCSHMVGSQSDPLFDHQWLDEVIVAGSFSSVLVDAYFPGNRPAQGRPSPCSGLNCSNSIPVPPSAASPEPVRSEQWGTLGMLVTLQILALRGITVDDSVVAPRGLVHSIFHPPRSSGCVVI